MIEQLSPNFDERPVDAVVDMLVLHYTGMFSADEARARLCDPTAKVSAHYLIEEDGTVYRLVSEEHRAWHAGVASWRGHADINARSIGIELVNPGHEFGLRTFPHRQMVALRELCLGILKRHPIAPRNVVGHSDVAPTRKQDPGELFDWHDLAANGIGLWPDHLSESMDEFAHTLETIGYDTTDIVKATEAFQRRYRPSNIDGVADHETQGLANTVLALCLQDS